MYPFGIYFNNGFDKEHFKNQYVAGGMYAAPTMHHRYIVHVDLSVALY